MIAARVTWSATSLTTTFYRYIVSRLAADGAGWDPLAHIYTKATTTFDDWAARRSLEEQYRVQVEDTNGITSVPSPAVPITLDASFRHLIVCNHDPSLNMELDVDVPQTIQMPDSVAVVEIDGGASQVFRERNRRRRLQWLGHILSTGDYGPAIWDQLLAAVDGDVPHLSVLDPWGNRYEAQLIVAEALLRTRSYARIPIEVIDVGDPVPVEIP